jgi:DNA-binding protein H-NS
LRHACGRILHRKPRLRSVVRLFEKLSFEEQKETLKDLQAAHELSRAAKRIELERQLAELGYGAPKEPAPAKALMKANGQVKPQHAAKKSRKTTSAKAKYRDGKTGETWSGRGRMARWLKAKQEAGEDIEKYLLN